MHRSSVLFVLLLVELMAACRPKPSTTDQAIKQPRADSQAVAIAPQSSTANQAVAGDFLIIPGKQVGPIRPTTSEADLLHLLGPSIVTAGDTLYGAEGEEFTGTTLYKGTADEVQIIFTDNEKRTHPQTVLIRPKLLDDEGLPLPNVAPTRWTTADGLRIGTTLKELEARNGKPFKVWGFEWDYGGMVSNWEGGKLAQSNKKAFLSIGLGAPVTKTPAQEKAYNQLLGDGEFLSSSAAMQVLNPSVQSMQVGF
ncbi:hypothetical protein EXU85_31305 [Spirosoma sp. KCTC 42546]|uniref:hypothetical protein n=1 Tax=Spirosoma sp. KCTC 42546 TaxID=2520506 RepID=UPI001157EB5A|nr:hypothetical protein [Spirosoma sp. KCTC 42546]QDK82854.1 hypothetical protein EXU85_31305 [Spirosoma sp. KCTC 42546]